MPVILCRCSLSKLSWEWDAVHAPIQWGWQNLSWLTAQALYFGLPSRFLIHMCQARPMQASVLLSHMARGGNSSPISHPHPPTQPVPLFFQCSVTSHCSWHMCRFASLKKIKNKHTKRYLYWSCLYIYGKTKWLVEFDLVCIWFNRAP